MQVEGSCNASQKRQSKTLMCLVPNCTVDVASGPNYLRRHKLCQYHLRAKSVEIQGQTVRFCQQCGRFQPVSDFKDDQRSCEAALQAHNARRRVKKDGKSPSRQEDRRNSKRTLASGAEDPSSSEDGGLAASRKLGMRKHTPQRSTQSQLHQSGAGSGDSLKVLASDDGDRPHSDATRSGKWTSYNSSTPNNSSGTSEGVGDQQQQQQSQQHCQQQDVSSILTANNKELAMAGPDRLQSQLQHLRMLQPSLPGSSFGTQDMHQVNFFTDGTQAVFSEAVPMHPGALNMLPQANGLVPGHQYFEMEKPSQISALNVHDGSAKATQDSLASWIVPREVMQQQQMQLAQFYSSTSNGLLQEAGQSLLRRHVQQPGSHIKVLQHNHQQQMSPQALGYHYQQQQQQPPFFGGRPGSWNSSRCSRMGSSGTDGTSHSASQTAAVGMAPAVSAAACPDAPALSGQIISAARLPASSTGAVLVKEAPESAGAYETQGFGSSNAMGAEVASSKPHITAMPGEACCTALMDMEAEALLDQALDVLLSNGPDLQSNDVLTQQHWSNVGTNSGIAPHANTSSPSSSNLYGGTGSGPLSLPSLPSAAAGGQPGAAALPSASLPHASHSLVAASTGPVCTTDLLHGDSPGEAPAGVYGGGLHSSMLAAGGWGSTTDAMVDVVGTAGCISGTPAPHPPVCLPGVGFSSIPASCGAVAAVGCATAAADILVAGRPQLAHPGALYPGATGVLHTQHTSTAMTGVCWPVPVTGCGGAGHGAGGHILPGITTTHPPAPATEATHLAAALSTALDTCGARAPVMGSTLGGVHDPHTLTLPGLCQQQQQHQESCLLQQQQQHQESRLLQQQLLLQQQQQEAEASLQQQHQQLLQLQEGLNARMTHTQQLVRLSIKLHGITPDQLPSTTVLAMERLLLNNPADMATILLQPSLRHGCIQFELDVLVKCPTLGQVHRETAPHADPTNHLGASPDESNAMLDDFSLDSLDAPKVQLLSSNSSNTEAVIDALSGAAAQAAVARVCQALPFAWLVDGILDLPLIDQDTATAAPAGSSSSGGGATVRSCVTSIYGQVGSFLGVWRAGIGLVQDWKPHLPDDFAAPSDDGPSTADCATVHPDLSSNNSSWQPRIQSCAPLVTALAERSAANSPTAAAAVAEVECALHPVPVRLQLVVAASSNAAGPVQLWCTQQGTFLPLFMQAEVCDLWVDEHGIMRELLCLDLVAGLPASAPGLLLLQAEQQYKMCNEVDACSSGSSTECTAQSGPAAEQLEQTAQRSAEDELPYMSSVVPVLICPSAAMAAEMTAHLLLASNHADVAQKLMHLGLLLDFWAMYQQQQEDDRSGGAAGDTTLAIIKAWRQSLLQQRPYLEALKVMGTQLLLLAMTCGMSATASHLHSIMTTLRSLEATLAASTADHSATAATTTTAAAAAQIAATAVAVEALPDANDAGSRVPGEILGVETSNSSLLVPGAAPQSRPVQEWVFEEVDCKAVNTGHDSCHGDGGGSSSIKQEVKGGSSTGHPVPAGREATAMSGGAGGQQTPLVILCGAAQMLGLLLLMYMLLDVAASSYRGQYSMKQLLATLLHFKRLMNIMLVPLVMMCCGALLAVWQFGTTGIFDSIAQAVQQPEEACHPSLGEGNHQTHSGKQPVEQAPTTTT